MKNNTTQKNIPHGWELKALGDLGEFKTGGVDKKIKSNEKPIKLVNYMDVYRNKFIDSSIAFMEVTANDGEIKTSQVEIGDMLFTPSSETPDDIGHSAVIIEYLPGTLFSYHLARLRFNKIYNNKIDLSFRAYFCNSMFVLKQFEKMSVGATRYTISKGKFESIQVLIPKSISEQQKIAEILGAVDEDIAKTQDVIEATEKLKKGLMQQLFTRGIGHAKFKKTKLGEIPEEWEIVKFGEVATIINGQVDPKQDQYKNMILVAPNHIESNSGRIIERESAEDQGAISGKYFVDKGDIIYSKIRPYLNKVALAVEQCLCSADMYPIKGTDRLDNVFLFYILLSKNFTDFANSNSARTGIPKINREELCSYEFVLPLVGEQQKIAEIISTVDDKISINKKLKNKLTLLKKGLMQDLLSGKVRVN